MNQAKSKLVAAAQLLSTISEATAEVLHRVGRGVPIAAGVDVDVVGEQLDDLGACLIAALNGVVELEAEVERLRRDLSRADQALGIATDPAWQRRELPPEQLAGVAVDLVDVSALLFPHYLRKLDPVVRRLVGLIEHDDDREEFKHTAHGLDVVEEIRGLYGLEFIDDSGGGRWHVERSRARKLDDGLHAGDAVDVLLGDGRWQPARFEVIFRDHPQARNGRLPRFHIATAGGSSFACHGDGEEWSGLLVRRARDA